MRTAYLLFLFSLAAADGSDQGGRTKRELLVRSKRRWVLSTIELQEEHPGPFPQIISKMYNDKKDPETQHHKFRIRGMGVTEEPFGVFSIDEQSGDVYVHRSVDREQFSIFSIKFDILDAITDEELDNELAFNVEIKDINDNAPQFSRNLMKADVKESSPEGYLPVQIVARDIDQENTENSRITLSLISQSPVAPTIELEQMSDGRLPQLRLKGCFDYEKAKQYHIIVQAVDHGTPSLSSTASIILDIVDANTHPPVFKERTYHGQVMEMATNVSVLRLAVDDKDTPKTPGWRAKYFFISGNENNNYHIETDPETNEGILKVIKGKDFEHTTVTNLKIGVKNEEPLFVCGDKETREDRDDSVTVSVKVIDINDAPRFEKEKVELFMKEEEEPGKVLFTPTVHDEDSDISKIRYVLLEDPADLVTIDKKTGAITTSKKMDRESPFVHDDIYKIVVGAVDDGEPPATGTCTVLVKLKDINDNQPKLVSNGIIMCGNKENKVMVPAKDADSQPYSGPFTFSLGSDDALLQEQWQLDPNFGHAGGLVSLRSLPNGNYSVPLVISDQQGETGHDTVEVMVCECVEGDVCRERLLPSSSLGASAIGVLFAGLLMFLLLLLIFVCKCQEKAFNHLPIPHEEGSHSLIKYNEEGGGAECTAEPILRLKHTNSRTVTDGLKQGAVQMSQTAAVGFQDMNEYNSSGHAQFSTWSSNRTNTYRGSSKQFQSFSMRSSQYTANEFDRGGSTRQYGAHGFWSNQHIADHINRRLDMMDDVNHTGYPPYEYADEGNGSKSQSLDKLTLCNDEDNLEFLNDLGPRFKTLEDICTQTFQEKNIQF